MCRSAADGGQRCAAHTRKKFDRAERLLHAAEFAGDPARITAAQADWEQAAAEYASTGEGFNVMIDRYSDAGAEQAVMYQSLAARGARMREANKEAAALIRAAEQAAQTTVMHHAERIGDFDPTRETVTAIRFTCETHDRPGQCDEQCLELICNMDPDPGVDYDPTGTSYGPPKPWTAYHLDTTHHAVHELTYTPNELIEEARTNGGPFDPESGRCPDCDGHYKHSTTCPTLRTPGAPDPQTDARAAAENAAVTAASITPMSEQDIARLHVVAEAGRQAETGSPAHREWEQFLTDKGIPFD